MSDAFSGQKTTSGCAISPDRNVQIFLGSTQLTDRHIDVIPPGLVVNVTASVLASKGDFIVKAVALCARPAER